jgi:DNA-binding NtrC family response regulator
MQRPLPHAIVGPPWWEIDFLPLMGESGLAAILGRIRTEAPTPASVARPLTEDQVELRVKAAEHFRLDSLDGSYPTLAVAVRQAQLATQSNCAVRIIGERGTGRQWLARAIHHAGAERNRPFLALDAMNLPSQAVDGVLFGPLGIYRADGAGSIYVHEPWQMTLDVQDELAQRIADSAESRPRIFAGTALSNFDHLIANGKMLKALADALAVLTIHLPPLRQRTAELPAVLDAICRQIGLKTPAVTPDAWDCLKAYSWPGNLDEFCSVIQHSTHQETEQLQMSHLPLPIRQARVAAELPAPPDDTMPGLDTTLEQVERKMIREALARAKGNQSRAAELLAIWRPRLIRRIKALGIDEAGPLSD